MTGARNTNLCRDTLMATALGSYDSAARARVARQVGYFGISDGWRLSGKKSGRGLPFVLSRGYNSAIYQRGRWGTVSATGVGGGRRASQDRLALPLIASAGGYLGITSRWKLPGSTVGRRWPAAGGPNLAVTS